MEVSTSYNLRYVARHLRYLDLPALAGEAVTVSSLQTASDDVIQHIRTKLALPHLTQRYTERQIERCLRKHHFWDATWKVEGRIDWPNQPKGLNLLAKLLYFASGDQGKSANEWLEGADLYEILREDIETGDVYLRLFLRSGSEHDGRPESEPWRGPLPAIPPSFFPHHYLIMDAALTNIEGCWMARHPYL
jgi:hypothetical protein